MNLNKKGYLTVEVILASVVAVSIAIFLMDITIKLVNVTDDAYLETELYTDKALIIKNLKELIKEDIKENGVITGTSITDIPEYSEVELIFNNNYSNSKTIKIEKNTLTYGEYTKKLNENLYDYNITTSGYSSDYILIKITAKNKFLKEDFEAIIIVSNKSNNEH